MTDEQKGKLNEALCEALEPIPAIVVSKLPQYWSMSGAFDWKPKYDFFTDGNAMLRLIEAMRERGWYWTGKAQTTKRWAAQFVDLTIGGRVKYATDIDSLPKATALAACRALGIEVAK